MMLWSAISSNSRAMFLHYYLYKDVPVQVPAMHRGDSQETMHACNSTSLFVIVLN